MKTTFAAAALAMVGSVAAAANGTAAAVYVTEVVTAFTTYCPAATVLTHGTNTYTVTEATTLTISDCPCTITKPATSAVAMTTGAPAPYSNGTTTAAAISGTAAGTGSVTGSALTSFTGAASSNVASFGGLAAIMGLAAYAL